MLSTAMSMGVMCQSRSNLTPDGEVISPDLRKAKKSRQHTPAPQHNVVLLTRFSIQCRLDPPQDVWCDGQAHVLGSRFRPIKTFPGQLKTQGIH